MLAWPEKSTAIPGVCITFMYIYPTKYSRSRQSAPCLTPCGRPLLRDTAHRDHHTKQSNVYDPRSNIETHRHTFLLPAISILTELSSDSPSKSELIPDGPSSRRIKCRGKIRFSSLSSQTLPDCRGPVEDQVLYNVTNFQARQTKT